MSAALSSILTQVSSGDFYSAHQKARTTSARLLSKAASPTALDTKASEAATLLWQVSKALLEKGQVGSGVDLAGLLVGVWKARGVECGERERAQVTQVIALVGPAGSWRKTYTDAVFSWSGKTGSGPAGDAAIHGYLGEVLYKEKSYELASQHLLICPTQDAGRTLASVMYDWAQLDPEGLTGLGRYGARGLFSYLEYQAILPARSFLAHFLSLALSSNPELLVVRFPFPPPASPLAKFDPSVEDEIYVTKLASLNFLQLCLRTCQTGAGEAVEKTKAVDGVMREAKGKGRLGWQGLLGRYEKEVSWLRRADVKESTTEMGHLYFGIKPPRPAGNAMMDMLGSMFGGAPPAAPAIGR